jgi:hypothetical protein
MALRGRIVLDTNIAGIAGPGQTKGAGRIVPQIYLFFAAML